MKTHAPPKRAPPCPDLRRGSMYYVAPDQWGKGPWFRIPQVVCDCRPSFDASPPTVLQAAILPTTAANMSKPEVLVPKFKLERLLNQGTFACPQGQEMLSPSVNGCARLTQPTSI